MSSDQPIRAAEDPIAVQLEAGKPVWWCACGRSKNQPFCDGSHAGTAFEPLEFTPKASKTYFLCRCKQTARQPLCDGSHSRP